MDNYTTMGVTKTNKHNRGAHPVWIVGELMEGCESLKSQHSYVFNIDKFTIEKPRVAWNMGLWKQKQQQKQKAFPYTLWFWLT
jgi:hypothetical protein